MKLKKILFSILTITLILSITGCGGGGSSSNNNTNNNQMNPANYSIQLNENTFYINDTEALIINFTTAVEPDSGSVYLIETTTNGAEINSLVQLFDDGNIINGDDILNDGVYSNKIVINKSLKGDYCFAVKYKKNNINFSSDTFTITIVNELTGIQLKEINECVNDVKDSYNYFIQSDPSNANKNISLYLANDNTVSNIYYDTNIIKWEKHDVMCFIFTGDTMTDGAGGRINNTKTKSMPYNSNVSQVKKKITLKSKKFSSEPDNIIGNNKVIIYAPFYDENEYFNTLFEQDVYDKFISDDYKDFFNVDIIYRENSASIEKVKSFSDYGIIIIHTHGGITDDVISFCSGEICDDTKDIAYKKDMSAKRLGKGLAGNQSEGVFGIGAYDFQKFVYTIQPKFIEQYCSEFSNSLVFNGSCHSLQNITLSDEFINKKSGSYIGFSESVYKSYNGKIAKKTFAELLEGKTVSESLSSAKTTHGNNDGSPKQAEPLISGSNDLTIITEGITNGSFELGGLNSWTTNGDVRVIPKLGAFNPDDGKYMGIISTGLGSVNESISEISQKFNIPAGKEKLELTYNFVSEEPLEYLNSKYDDYYKILVITPSGDTVLVDSGSINFFSDESFWNPADINFDGGDNTAYYIGWQTKSLNLSQYISSEGKRKGYTLIIIVGDKGDSIYDSALLIDNIKLVEP